MRGATCLRLFLFLPLMLVIGCKSSQYQKQTKKINRQINKIEATLGLETKVETGKPNSEEVSKPNNLSESQISTVTRYIRAFKGLAETYYPYRYNII